MPEGRLEVESKSQKCLVIIKREFTTNNLPKRRVLSSTHGVVGGRRLVTASYPINYCSELFEPVFFNIPVNSDNIVKYHCLGKIFGAGKRIL